MASYIVIQFLKFYKIYSRGGLKINFAISILKNVSLKLFTKMLAEWLELKTIVIWSVPISDKSNVQRWI